MTPISLSLKSYQTPVNPLLGNPRPEHGLRDELLRLSAKRVMAALFRDDSFSQDAIFWEIEEVIPKVIEIALRNTLTYERAIYQAGLEDGFPDYFYQRYSPLLAHIFPSPEEITDINLDAIEVPDDLITAIVNYIKEVFQYWDTLQILEEIHPHITPEMTKISNKAIILTRGIGNNYEKWAEWMSTQVENSETPIKWENIDHVFFTVAFPVRAQQSLEAIFTTTALIQVLEGYKTPDINEIEENFISLLQKYLKKQAIFSATDTIGFENEEEREKNEEEREKRESILNIRAQWKQELEIILWEIQQALSKRSCAQIFKRFREDIDKGNQKAAFMGHSNRLGIQSTKEHWVWSYGIRELLMIDNRR